MEYTPESGLPLAKASNEGTFPEYENKNDFELYPRYCIFWFWKMCVITPRCLVSSKE